MPQPTHPKAPRPRPPIAPPSLSLDALPAYAELHCRSNFSFLTGASHPQELVARAAQLGSTALALTDECSVAGVVRAHGAAKDTRLKLIIGSEITLADGLKMVLLVENLRGYETLCELITKGRRAAPKGEYRLAREDIPLTPQGLTALWIPPPGKMVSETISTKMVSDTIFLASRFPGLHSRNLPCARLNNFETNNPHKPYLRNQRGESDRAERLRVSEERDQCPGQ